MKTKKELAVLLKPVMLPWEDPRADQDNSPAKGFRKEETGKYKVNVFKDADNVFLYMKRLGFWAKGNSEDDFVLWMAGDRAAKLTFTDSSQVSSFAKKLYDIAKKKGLEQNQTASDYEKVLKMWLKEKRNVQYGGGPNEYD